MVLFAVKKTGMQALRMNTAIKIFSLVVLALHAALCAAAQDTSNGEKVHPGTALQFGITRCYEARFPIAVFNASQDKVYVTGNLFPRSPFDAAKTPLPDTLGELPDIVTLTLGRYSDDLLRMADLGLILPLDTMLVELGLSPEDMFPVAREAVTYRGKIWGLPWHSIIYSLVAHKYLLPKGAATDSWESLLDSSFQSNTVSLDPANLMSIPFNDFRLVEQMATSSGAEVFSCANPGVLTSEAYLRAFQLLAKYKLQGQIVTRMENTPMTKAHMSVLGVGYLDSIYEGNEYGIVPFPNKMMQKDAPSKMAGVPALMEVFAVKKNDEKSLEAVKVFLRWMLKPETQWMVFQATNDVIQTKEWTLDSVHVPLWKSRLDSPLFKGAARDFPGYPALVESVRTMRVPRTPPLLDEALLLQVEEYTSMHLGKEDFETGLKALLGKFKKQILQTPVESHAYDAY